MCRGHTCTVGDGPWVDRTAGTLHHPLILFALVSHWLPESARYDAASGESEKALATLQKIADENGKPMLLGRLIVDDVAQINRGRLMDLLVPDLKWTTLLLWFIWNIFHNPFIEKLGRKKTMALEFIIFVVSIIFLFICTSNRTWLTFILFVARGIISGVFQAAYVYTPE
ncbi:putative synaptic vesicle 2-related protein-like [Penaeus vannamei]|uniref:Putative synaptic vesicle 2-related protein-like n=1 Tax=Penaeus vannamei TaxID=6689 RepID=A0A423SBC4_PENVA|nr:putative synaptic vesicle 2-related protein-like [Penaeus vannamei]